MLYFSSRLLKRWNTTLRGFLSLEQANFRLNQSAQEKFNLTKDRFLRGMLECFQTMFRDGEMEKAAYQMNYLLKCCRRWLAKAPNPEDRTLTGTQYFVCSDFRYIFKRFERVF